MSRGWLVVFGKAPRAGLVKTRLSPPLSLEQSASFYAEMLADVLDASGRFARALDLEAVLAFHPPGAVTELVHRTPPDFRLHAQRGSSLAERMANAFAEAAAAGVDRIILRGSDSPALGVDVIAEALEALDGRADVVLTPDQSGGYALIGMRIPHPRVFELPMSTTRVLDQTINIAESEGLHVALTKPAFDLDTADDFACLDAIDDSVRTDLCPRTVEAISLFRSDRVL